MGLLQWILAGLIVSVFPALVDAGSFTTSTTQREDRGAMYVCGHSTKDLDSDGNVVPCTGPETVSYIDQRFHEVLEEYAKFREKSLANESGLNIEELKAIADDPDISDANKCALMADKGVQSKFETYISNRDNTTFTCP